MRYFNISIFAILMGIMILILTGCATPKGEKHFYLKYGETGYLHSPTITRDTWMTFKVIAPKYEETKEAEEEYTDQWNMWGID